MSLTHNPTQDVDETIQQLMTKFDASNESHLADMIGVHRSTISAWKARGNVPERYVRLLSDDYRAASVMGEGKPEANQAEVRRLLSLKSLSPSGQAALKLALFRFLQDSEGVLDSFPETIKALSLGMTQLTIGAAAAMEEIEDRRRKSDCSPQEAMAMIVHEEMSRRE